MTDSLALKNRNIIDAISKLTTKSLMDLKESIEQLLSSFDIEKVYDKINRNKIFEQLENTDK